MCSSDLQQLLQDFVFKTLLGPPQSYVVFIDHVPISVTYNVRADSLLMGEILRDEKGAAKLAAQSFHRASLVMFDALAYTASELSFPSDEIANALLVLRAAKLYKEVGEHQVQGSRFVDYNFLGVVAYQIDRVITAIDSAGNFDMQVILESLREMNRHFRKVSYSDFYELSSMDPSLDELKHSLLEEVQTIAESLKNI